MKEKEKGIYEEWLSTIANTRLMFNKMSDLEKFLETNSIHSNGIKRSFTSLQRLRSAFRDLKVELNVWTHGIMDLEEIMYRYKKAWNFYQANLMRRKDPYAMAMQLLRYYYPPYHRSGISSNRIALFRQVEEQGIDVAVLCMMLLKAMPGYYSKEGDVKNMTSCYEDVLNFFGEFVDSGTLFTVLPSITIAREESNKSRIMLLFHVLNILRTYESYAEQYNLYQLTCDLKELYVDLDITGFWNECEGKGESTNFWQIEEASDKGTYFATLWKKDADNQLNGLCYALFFVKGDNGKLTAYLLHPEAIKHRMLGQAYGDSDHVWYFADMPEVNAPTSFCFERLMVSAVWQKRWKLSRVTDPKIVHVYEKWFDTCHIIKPYKHWEYVFYPAIHAITHDAIYISAEEEGVYYRVPKSSFEGFDKIQINDNVGIMTMGDKQLLVFDEFLLYIPIESSQLEKYGIEKVENIL